MIERDNAKKELKGPDKVQDIKEKVSGISFFGINVCLHQKGQKINVVKSDQTFEIHINVQRYKSEQLALREAAFKCAELAQVQRFLQASPRAAINIISVNKNYPEILRLQGIRNLNGEGGNSLAIIKSAQLIDLNLSEQFLFACEHYALTKSFPIDLNPDVLEALDSLPRSDRGLHVLDEIISDEFTPEINVQLYALLEAANTILKARDKDNAALTTDKFKYQPKVGAGEKVPLNPDDIETKVTPFFGGYFRGHICRYDPESHSIVQDKSDAHVFVPDEIPDLNGITEYKYETVFDPNGDNLLELPYDALPLPNTLFPRIPRVKFEIIKNEKGSFYLRIKPQLASGPNKKEKVSFRFIIHKTAGNALSDVPDEEDFEPVGGMLDEDAESFLAGLEQESFLTISEKSKRCANYVRKRFKYPKNDEERNAMNTLYLKSGHNFMKTIITHGITDCYWSNIFCGELLRRLNINHRVAAGHYVKKDPRFDFAAVAGIGHAWGEVWTGEEWLKCDATPADTQNRDEESKKNEEHLDGDYGDSPEPVEQKELTPMEIQTMFETLINATTKPEQSTEDAIFRERVGVSLDSWKTVEAFVLAVNNIVVPAEFSIRRRPSTIREEWDELFKLIYKRREIPQRSFRGPVDQDEAEALGGYLDDPVLAVIDTMAGHGENPMGFRIPDIKLRESVEVMEFEDDVILDLTKSMAGEPALEQKKMALSGLYNLMMLNRRLNLETHKRAMKSPITLRSHIESFKGDTLVSVLHDQVDEINEKTLCFLYDELEKLQRGNGNLLGALKAYEASLDMGNLGKIKSKKMAKVLTIISDGGVLEKAEAIEIIKRLRKLGIVVQGIGFGNAAQDIRVICHDPNNEDAGVVLTDVRQAVLTRHKMLTKALVNL